ncbi:MAG: glycosyltransferase [Verrucomicrobiota bacterium]
MDSPYVSIIMPVYNTASYVHEAIDSVLKQSFQDFELLVYDDGSTDGSVSVIESFSDPRIRLVKSEVNQGYTTWLNRGLQDSRGELIARMDADDISAPERLEKQVAWMRKNPQGVLLGTCCRLIDAKGAEVGRKLHPTSNAALQWELLLDNPFQHPSVMMRAEILRQYGLEYDLSLQPTEDYGLWAHLALHGEVGNLPECLLDYRVHDTQISQEKRHLQLSCHDRVVEHQLGPFDDILSLSSESKVALKEFVQGEVLEKFADKASGVLKDYLQLKRVFINRNAFESNQEVQSIKARCYPLIWRSIMKSSSCGQGFRFFWGAIQCDPGFARFVLGRLLFKRDVF